MAQSPWVASRLFTTRPTKTQTTCFYLDQDPIDIIGNRSPCSLPHDSLRAEVWRVTIQTNFISLSCLLSLHGCLRSRHNHSRPAFLTTTGALFTFPAHTSTAPPTTIATLTPAFSKTSRFSQIHFSCRGAP